MIKLLKVMLAIKPYEQKKSGYCGPASLKMVLHFYGLEKSEEELGKICGVKKRLGMEAERFKKAARRFGFKILIKDFADFADINFYLKRKIPIIVDWFSKDDGHYSVVVGLDKKYIYLADPEFDKIRKMDKEIFKRVWFDFSGAYLRRKNDIIVRRIIVIYK